MDKLEIGDKVEVVEYGNVEHYNDEGEVFTKDSMPHLIGQQGVIGSIKFNAYGVSGIIGKYYPFYRDQLKKL